jgi:AraC family transcriptional regulator of arabinose operon
MDSRVQIALAEVHRDYGCEVSLKTVARLVNISPSRLRHLFKAEVGTCFASYVKTVRLQKAKELLETTFLTVKQIMSQVGVADESHFVRDFKGRYGLPPMKYRMKLQAQPFRPIDSHPGQ